MVRDCLNDGLRYRITELSSRHAERMAEIEVSWNPRPWSQQVFQDELSKPYSAGCGVVKGDRLVGYLCAHRICDEVHILSFAIAPEERGARLGELLLTKFLASVASAGAAVVTLDVRASNKIAQRLYQKVGFSVVGVRKHYYASNNEDALTMRLSTAHLPR